MKIVAFVAAGASTAVRILGQASASWLLGLVRTSQRFGRKRFGNLNGCRRTTNVVVVIAAAAAASDFVAKISVGILGQASASGFSCFPH